MGRYDLVDRETERQFPGGTLSAISCTAIVSCFAVGEADYGTLMERSNGTQFRIDARLIPGSLNDVACATPTTCFATGAFLWIWNGTAWTIGGNHKDNNFSAISCTGPTNCMAVGAKTKQWNGTKWTIVAGPNSVHGPRGGIAGLSCTSATNCYAVGTRINNAEANQTWIVHWNGATWTAMSSPSPADFFGASLNAVSCVGPTNCVAVGAKETGSTYGIKGNGGTLIEQWNGTRWAIIDSPSPGGVGTLNGVSCTTPTTCIAVGVTGTGQTLVEQS